jgi:hypothetical protein
MENIFVTIRITPEEKKLIAKHARAEGKSITGYLRACYLADMVMGGDLAAVKIVGRELGKVARQKFFENMVPPDNVLKWMAGKGL